MTSGNSKTQLRYINEMRQDEMNRETKGKPRPGLPVGSRSNDELVNH